MEITCEFEEMTEWHGIFDSPALRRKLGRYDSCNMNIPGLGVDKWLVLANITPEPSLEHYLEIGLTPEEVVQGCISFLNKPPTRRSRKPRFGSLELRHFNILGEKISVSMTTSDRNNKYFWGRGAKVCETRKISKRGRPRKVRK
jgi:hypothetical protein